MTHPDPLKAARERMAFAKRRLSTACAAVLRGESDAGTLARIALAEVEVARARLRQLTEDAQR